MKKIVTAIILAAFLALSPAFAQDLRYTEASDLTLVGKLFPDTPNPYHRVDTVKYKGFTKSEISFTTSSWQTSFKISWRQPS